MQWISCVTCRKCDKNQFRLTHGNSISKPSKPCPQTSPRNAEYGHSKHNTWPLLSAQQSKLVTIISQQNQDTMELDHTEKPTHNNSSDYWGNLSSLCTTSTPKSVSSHVVNKTPSFISQKPKTVRFTKQGWVLQENCTSHRDTLDKHEPELCTIYVRIIQT